MKKINIIPLFFILIGCVKEEFPLTPRPIGDIVSKQIDMESNYSQQVFYTLSNNAVIQENEKTEWDLAFESSLLGWNIVINSATFSQIAELDNNFNDIIDINNLEWSWDSPEGIYDGTAIGDYRQKEKLYVIDRGYNLNGSSRGYKKLIVDSVNNNSFFLKYADLDNTNIKEIVITKNNLYNFEYLSLDNEQFLNIEPEKEAWDLLFTQYTHLFTDNLETPAYLVTGVLINYMNNVMVATDTTNNFLDINFDMIGQYDFTNKQNAIGYNWKSYSFSSQSYTVDSETTYIISDIDGRYFKLHFVDFYNDNGEKGYPKFEIQEL